MSPLCLVTLDVTNTLIKVIGGVGSNYASKLNSLLALHLLYRNVGVLQGKTSMQR